MSALKLERWLLGNYEFFAPSKPHRKSAEPNPCIKARQAAACGNHDLAHIIMPPYGCIVAPCAWTRQSIVIRREPAYPRRRSNGPSESNSPPRSA